MENSVDEQSIQKTSEESISEKSSRLDDQVILRTAHDLLPILDLSQSVARQSTSICNLKYDEDHNESEDDSDESDGELDDF